MSERKQLLNFAVKKIETHFLCTKVKQKET